MNNGKEKSGIVLRQTLLAIYHPEFRKGYQDGRNYYFKKQKVLSDKQFVDDLQSIFEDNPKDQAEEQEGCVYYAVGSLVGEMSGCVIPRQPYEDNTQELQEAFLVKVAREYEATGQVLIDTVRQFWAMQDRLAVTLDADAFELMLNRGAEKECCL